MVTTLTNKIRFDLAIAISASLVFATRVLDKIIMLIAAPYLLKSLNTLKTQRSPDSMEKISSLLLWVQAYNLVVFHFLVVILAFIIFLNKKYRPYKKDLLFAYLIIAVVAVLNVMLAHLLKIKT